jgi:hypothetical protein
MPAHSTHSAAADDIFFTALGNGHSVRAACASALYARRCVYRWRKTDPEFAARWATALSMAADMLEDVADRRGRAAWLEGGRHAAGDPQLSPD